MSSGTPMVRAADIRHDWYVVDASDQVLGRLASAVARVLSGKHRPGWVAHLDTGDFVVVTNAERVQLTGRKAEEKVYHRHTGYPGGLKTVARAKLRAKYPERLIEEAVRGMLPKTKLGRSSSRSSRFTAAPRIRTRRSSPKPARAPASGRGRSSKEELLAVEIQHRATGRRKTSVARVRLVPGPGAITVNRRSLDEYFPNNVLKMIIKQPLLSTETAERFDIHVAVAGGGPSGQAGAIRHGISRALTEYNAELRKKLKKDGFLSRDPADERTEEVRAARRARPVPVQQAVTFVTRGRWHPHLTAISKEV